jgi:hypothetical protein
MHSHPSNLHVISVISNPVRYLSRVRLFKEFMAEMASSGVTHWIIEAVYGERAPSVAEPDNKHHIIVRCDHEIWLKENLINVAARHLPADAKYIMWADGDIRFERADWASETIEYLQHHPVVQPFSHCIDYGPQGDILETHKSFGFCFRKGQELGIKNKLGGWKYGGPYWHPGYACAYRMDTWNALGGMIERAVCGSGDYHMACALIGQGVFSHPGHVHPNYKHMIEVWQNRATHAVKHNLGYLPGTVHHAFHGKKADRKYVERWQIVTENDFDPYRDLTHDRHGVLQLTVSNDKRGRKLRDDLMAYFRARREDPE